MDRVTHTGNEILCLYSDRELRNHKLSPFKHALDAVYHKNGPASKTYRAKEKGLRPYDHEPFGSHSLTRE
jgi:hypothetical protein